MIHYVTYATHEHGLFKTLVENPYVKINVLGFGKKWNGFNDKMIGVHEFTKSLPEDDYIVFLDGFDTKIVRNPIDIIQRFNNYRCDILASEEPLFAGKYITRKVFGSCKKQDLNSGMYMGKVKHVREMTKIIITQKITDDDQTALTMVCNLNVLNIKTDTKNIIFYNNGAKRKSNQYYFVSYPSGRHDLYSFISRMKRGAKEYTKYFILEIIIILLSALLLWIYFRYDLKPRKKI